MFEPSSRNSFPALEQIPPIILPGDGRLPTAKPFSPTAGLFLRGNQNPAHPPNGAGFCFGGLCWNPRAAREFLDSRFLQDFSPASVGLLLGSVLSLAGGRGNRLCFFRIVFASGALQKNN